MSDRATPADNLCDSGAVSRTSHNASRCASLAMWSSTRCRRLVGAAPARGAVVVPAVPRAATNDVEMARRADARGERQELLASWASDAPPRAVGGLRAGSGDGDGLAAVAAQSGLANAVAAGYA